MIGNENPLVGFWNAAIQRGLFPVAIAANSKAPILEGWNVHTLPVAHPGTAAIGLRCGDGGLTAFDVDIDDPALSSRVLAGFRTILGAGVAVRYGRKPRFLIPFYLEDAPVQGRTFTFASGEKLQLIGGQFIAYGIHPQTQQPYEWENFDAPWPRLTKAQLEWTLSQVPLYAGTSLRFSTDYEVCAEQEVASAVPQNQSEWDAGRQATERLIGQLKHDLMGRTEGRGSIIFGITGALNFAVRCTLASIEEIENAVTDAGHRLDERVGGRTLGDEIRRAGELPVLRGNSIMAAILQRRGFAQGVHDALVAPSMPLRSGFELSLEDHADELPWIVHQRILGSEVHFFTGHSGAGKSSVVSDLTYHYLVGAPWLEADIERTDGHVMWIAAEDDYGTERRMRHMLRALPNGVELAQRFHLIRGSSEPLAFERNVMGTYDALAAMGKRIDIIVLDTWGASGLVFKDNDTSEVLKAMFILKNIGKRTGAAILITDHLPLTGEDALQKGNGAKSGNSGFMYRVTAGKNNAVSIDCGKARGAPKAQSYAGEIMSENYGTDSKGRATTVNRFKRTANRTDGDKSAPRLEQELAAYLAGAVMRGYDAMINGQIVPWDTVAAELGRHVKSGMLPEYASTQDTMYKLFGDHGVRELTRKDFLIRLGPSHFGIRNPASVRTVQTPNILNGSTSFSPPANKAPAPWDVPDPNQPLRH